MKKLIYLLIIISFGSCSTSQRCPTTDKKYFFRGVKGSKALYNGRSKVSKHNKMWAVKKYKRH
jgi:hypothetical protein